MRIVGICVALMFPVCAMAAERGYRDHDKNCMYFTKDPPAVFFAFGGKYWTLFSNAKTLSEAESISADIAGQLLAEGIPEENLPRILLETHQVFVPAEEKRDVQVKRDGTLIAPRNARVSAPEGYSVWTQDKIACITPKKNDHLQGAVVFEGGEYQ